MAVSAGTRNHFSFYRIYGLTLSPGENGTGRRRLSPTSTTSTLLAAGEREDLWHPGSNVSQFVEGKFFQLFRREGLWVMCSFYSRVGATLLVVTWQREK